MLSATVRRQLRGEDCLAQPVAVLAAVEEVAAFQLRYTLLLAETDALHRTLSGSPARKILERSWKLFGDQRDVRLARISNGHLYNLRHSQGYQRELGAKGRTEPTNVKTGEAYSDGNST